jgi:O-antigen/teichoic acid export membrane protein
MLLLLRRVLIIGISALSTAIVARRIGAGSFGVLASAQGLVFLLQGIADFGFSLVLARELASVPDKGKSLVGASVVVATTTGALTTLVLVAIALASGPSSERGTVLLILAPGLALTGIGTVRQSFLVLYRTRRLATIDVATNVVQSVATIAVALAGGGLYAVAIVVSLGTVANPLLIAWAGRRLHGVMRPEAGQVRAFLRSALPLGLASFLSSVYFTVDLVLLAWLVNRRQVGEYAAAVKFLNLLVMIPGFVMAGVLPGLSSLRSDRQERSRLAARVWHWLMALGLPVCVAGAVFAPTIIHVAFGRAYSASIPMFRVLCVAAVIALASNVLGVVLNSLAVARPQVIQNTVALVFNVTANILLAPKYGPIASAWLTVATELIVVTGSLIALRGRVDFRPALAVSGRPIVASGALAAVGLLLAGEPVIAIPSALVSFLVVIALLRAWPEELMFPRGLPRYRLRT